jgi:hypothetical protein
MDDHPVSFGILLCGPLIAIIGLIGTGVFGMVNAYIQTGQLNPLHLNNTTTTAIPNTTVERDTTPSRPPIIVFPEAKSVLDLYEEYEFPVKFKPDRPDMMDGLQLTSSDPTVATINGFIITAKKAGKSTIKAHCALDCGV